MKKLESLFKRNASLGIKFFVLIIFVICILLLPATTLAIQENNESLRNGESPTTPPGQIKKPISPSDIPHYPQKPVTPPGQLK